ncbi:MAG: sigma-70 family RNA polymerase sigma factor [Phycisphaerales bacterium]|nr:sigma-70 family RNA polymerase sigma factor [Phycisphaerales bacterium]
MTETDESLMARVASRDLEAFGALHDRYAPRLFGLLLKLLSDRVDAEDILQDVFWQVWRKADRYDPSLAAPAVWLLQITRNRAIDVLRARRSRGFGEGGDHEAPEVPATRSDTELVARTRTALRALPREQCEAIELAFYRGLTGAQIAQHQDAPLGTIKTRIRLGMQKLRDLLHTCDEVPAR